jgi:hypothetical protein
MFVSFDAIGLLAAIDYTIVEILERFGMKRKHAHLLAIPIGIVLGIISFQDVVFYRKVIYGMFVGILSVGSCDTLCNVKNLMEKRKK